jgi:hypothetical protein
MEVSIHDVGGIIDWAGLGLVTFPIPHRHTNKIRLTVSVSLKQFWAEGCLYNARVQILDPNFHSKLRMHR